MEDNIKFTQKILTLLEEGKVEVVISILRQRIPKQVFKFFRLDCGYDELLDHLKNNEVFFNLPSKMNDIREFHNVIFEKGSETDNKIANNMDKTQLRNTRIACFTYDKNCINNEKMWNEYANNGNGILVEFEVFLQDNLYPVLYSNKNVIIPRIENVHDDEMFVTNRFLFDTLKLILKEEKYSHENEIRLIYNLGYERTFSRNGRYVNISSILRIKKIYFGSNCSEKNKERINELWKNENIVSEIK